MALIISLGLYLALLDIPRNTLCTKPSAPMSQQIYVLYASQISGNDKSFLALLQGENDLFDPRRRSEVYDPKTNRYEDSYGFCQIHRQSHREIVEDSRFFSNPFWQLDRCWELYRTGTVFGATKNVFKNKKYFQCP